MVCPFVDGVRETLDHFGWGAAIFGWRAYERVSLWKLSLRHLPTSRTSTTVSAPGPGNP
ncbi:hypothetical protein [Nocardia sp. CA-119907]|uniref:hypothetical protein n=1 Tax=Nocardia sp. CA-119907 TaxID=3239973 RepID=UPI003D97E220